MFGHGIIRELQPRLWNGRTVLRQARRIPAETYFLSRHTQLANVKVSDGLLDIRVKIGETPERYEVFQPKGTFQFPVTADQVGCIAARLHVALPESIALSDGVTFDAFLAMAQRHPDLMPVDVETLRWGFTIDGVACEYAHVWFNGALVESACVECADYAAMRSVIDELGLSERPNVNYLVAAARIVGIQPPLVL